MSEPSKWAIEAADIIAPHRLVMSSPIAHAAYHIQDAIDAACAEKDKRIAELEKELNCALEALKVK